MAKKMPVSYTHLDVYKRQVGDRSYDMKGALKFGLYAVGAGYGYGDPGELEAAGAQAIAQTVEELTEILLGEREV